MFYYLGLKMSTPRYVKQWAAVTTCLFDKRVPPQKDSFNNLYDVFVPLVVFKYCKKMHPFQLQFLKTSQTKSKSCLTTIKRIYIIHGYWCFWTSSPLHILACADWVLLTNLPHSHSLCDLVVGIGVVVIVVVVTVVVVVENVVDEWLLLQYFDVLEYSSLQHFGPEVNPVAPVLFIA